MKRGSQVKEARSFKKNKGLKGRPSSSFCRSQIENRFLQSKREKEKAILTNYFND